MSETTTRIAALRAILSDEGLEGFLLPRGDEYLGEYVPACAERLAWLSGFSGSAGFAIILVDEAGIFSDGRYQIQMRQQVDPAIFSINHMYEITGPAWLVARARSLRIGYDPHTISQADLQAYLEAGCTMVAMARNPVDAIWHDQPAAPATMLSCQPLELTGTDASARRAIIARHLTQDGQDYAILADPTGIAWMLAIRAHDLPFLPVARCLAIIAATGQVELFIEPARVAPDIAATLGDGVSILPPDSLHEALGRLSGARVRLDPLRSNAWFWQELHIAGATTVAGTDPCLRPRACKTTAEQAGMREAHVMDGIALCRFLYWLDHNGLGLTEIDVADHLLALRMENPACMGASFASISAAGANAAIMHYSPARHDCARLEAQSFFLIDSGGQYRAGTTDVTRTIWLGSGSAPRPWQNQYTRVLKGLIALSRLVFPASTPGYRLDPVARLALWEVGLDFDHGAGHGLGSYLSVHEWPLGFARRPVLDPIEEHMVLTNEPGYYEEGSHGIRLENVMQTRRHNEDGSFLAFDNLTLAPIDRRGIDPALLTQTERDWLDAFHADVAAKIAPHLQSEEKAWLLQACSPL